MRKLSDTFMEALQNGTLQGIADLVRSDLELDFQIRKNRVHIYYRGGKILDLQPNRQRNYHATFDTNYCKRTGDIPEDIDNELHLNRMPQYPDPIKSSADTQRWIKAMPTLKTLMDEWFEEHPKAERAQQQLVVDQNNKLLGSAASDYFIIDIEYANKEGRFDMVAMNLSSNTKSRVQPRLTLMEMKVGDNAISSGTDNDKMTPGLRKHVSDVATFLEKEECLITFRAEMMGVINQKNELGLLHYNDKLNNVDLTGGFSEDEPEFILLLADHNPKSTVLKRELTLLDNPSGCELRILLVDRGAYTLRQKNMLNLKEGRNVVCQLLRSTEAPMRSAARV